MFDRFENCIVPYRQFLSHFTKLPISIPIGSALLLGLAVATAQPQPSFAYAKKKILSRPVTAPAIPTHAVEPSNIIPDGVYLYGQSPETEQVGSGYMVFESSEDRVVGAFYMPRSSFDCFYGNLESQQLALTVVNSYENTPYAYAIGLAEYPVAGQLTGTLELQGLHRMASVSENDHRILEVCKENYQDEVWN